MAARDWHAGLRPHFQVIASPAVSTLSEGARFGGELDVVLPFAGRTLPAQSELLASALFVQQSITRWWDRNGQLHNDLRYGLVYRFRMSGHADSDVLWLSLLQQYNTKLRHEVLVSGVDYWGRWGNGSFRHFSPTTGWRTNRLGRKERALEGMEFATRLDLTTTLRMHATGYRWEAEDGSGRFRDGVRFGLGLRPHPWLNLTGEYDHADTRSDGLSHSPLSHSRLVVAEEAEDPPRPRPWSLHRRLRPRTWLLLRQLILRLIQCRSRRRSPRLYKPRDSTPSRT